MLPAVAKQNHNHLCVLLNVIVNKNRHKNRAAAAIFAKGMLTANVAVPL